MKLSLSEDEVKMALQEWAIKHVLQEKNCKFAMIRSMRAGSQTPDIWELFIEVKQEETPQPTRMVLLEDQAS